MVNVAEWLQEVGISPSGLADELGLPRGQISRLIVGEEEPDKLTTWALAGLREHRLRDRLPTSPAAPKQLPKKELAQELSDNTWTGVTARLALPILIDTAVRQRTVTYSELHEAVVARGGKADIGKMTKYAFPLGRIASAMQRERLPPLTSIVVKGSTGLPSWGIDVFIKEHLDLNRAERDALENDADYRREKVKQLWDEVYAYKDWPEVMDRLGVTGDPNYDR